MGAPWSIDKENLIMRGGDTETNKATKWECNIHEHLKVMLQTLSAVNSWDNKIEAA